MVSISDLESIGISNLILQLKSSTGDISVIDDGVIVINTSYYDEIFYKCLNNKDIFFKIANSIEDEAIKTYYIGLYELIFNDFNKGKRIINSINLDDVHFMVIKAILNGDSVSASYDRFGDVLSPFIKMLDKNINDGNYLLCINIIDLIKKYDDSFYLNVLKSVLSRSNDNLRYIARRDIYKNDVILDNYHKFERKLIFYLEIGMLDEVYKINEFMKDIYADQSPLVFEVVTLMISKIRHISSNRRVLSSRNEMGVVGDLDSVLIALMGQNDLYRVIEIVNKKYYQNINDVRLIIYKKLIDIMSFYLNRNKEFIDCEMDLNTVSDNSADYILGRYNLSSINSDILKNIEETNEEYIDDSINYYEVYTSCLLDKDYKGALNAIRKFTLKLKRLGSSVKFDYIEKDLIIRIENQTDEDSNIKHYDENIECAEYHRNIGDYKNAISYYYEAFKYVIRRNPVDLCKIARCYVGLNDLDSAIKMYEIAINEFMYPDEILEFLDVLLKNKNYEKVIKYSDEYEKYYPLDNPRLHYMLAICYVNTLDFSNAIKELWTTENINNELFGVEYELSYEMDIISRLESGEVVEPFTMDTFIDFELSDFDKTVKSRLNKFNEVVSDPLGSILSTIGSDDGSFDNKMSYLFSLLKIYIIDKDEESYKKIYAFIGDYIEKVDEPLEDKKRFTLSLKNYRNL